jgi:large subunit ribosomal protein L28
VAHVGRVPAAVGFGGICIFLESFGSSIYFSKIKEENVLERKSYPPREAVKPEAEEGDRADMKTFDPWPVFFRREWRRNWPFLTGFAITGFLITKMTANFTEEDLKNSKFVQEHKKH